MENLREKLDRIEEDLGFLEEVVDRSLVEDRIEELKLIRNELEKELHYVKPSPSKTDS